MIKEELDAVELMRQVREKMGADMRDLSFEEQRAYIERHASEVRKALRSRREADAVQ